MKLALVVAMVAGMVGCTEIQQVVHPVTQDEAVAHLRMAASGRQMKWNLTNEGDGFFCALAKDKDENMWIACRRKPSDAAEEVANALDNGEEPFSRPSHVIAGN